MISTRGAAVALLMALTVPGTAPGQPTARNDSGWSGEVGLVGVAHDNLFQAPPGEPEEDVRGLRAEGRFRWRWDRAGSWLLDGAASATDYDSGLDPSQSVSVALVREGRHGVELELEYANDRPSIETDVFDQADVTRFTGRYVFRPTRAWQITAVAIGEQQNYSRATGRDNDFVSIGGAVRYRGFGRRFSPELGYARGERDVDTSSGSHEQDEFFVRVISAPVDPLYLSLRFRLRERDYTTDDPEASNLGRSDDRKQWALTAVWRMNPRWALNLYLAREESDSSRAGVDFETSVALLGVSWRFGDSGG